MDNQLAALTASRRALCEVVLSTSQGSAQLSLRLDEARLHVDSLISEGVLHGAHAALTSVGSHYSGVDFEVVGRGRTPGRSKTLQGFTSNATPHDCNTTNLVAIGGVVLQPFYKMVAICDYKATD